MSHLNNRMQSLGYRFGMLYRLNISFLNEQLKPLGISAGQVSFLAEILHSDVPMTQDEISVSLAIDPAATARAVEQLRKKGLAVQVVNPENRRQKLVSATPEARKMADNFFDTLKRVSDIFGADLTEEERQMMIRFMDRMIGSAKRKKYEKHK